MKRVLSLSQWLITLLLCLFLIVPVVLSMAVGLTRNYIRGFKSGWTLDWVAQVWDMYHASIWMSLLVALCTLVIVLAAGVPAGYVLARRQSRASRLIEEFLTLPVALPGLATALGLIVAYGGFGGFRESLWFIVVGHVVFTLPFMVRSVAAVASGQNLKTLEEGAASLGASFWQRFRTIVLPNVQPGILA
ncbi:ABC transporter permease subunit, partial [Ralstonia sp.]